MAFPIRRAGLIVGTFFALTGCSADGQNVTVGTSLPEGTYDAVVTWAGGQIQTQIVVGPTESGSALPFLLLAVALIGLIALAYLVVVVPRRRRQAYEQALAQLDAGEFRRALPELTRLETRLPGKLRTEARFFIAFALFQIDALDEADYRLSALRRENPADASVCYLLAYLRFTRRDHEGAESVLDTAMADGLLTGRKMRRLYAVVKFQRAAEAVSDGRLDAAADLFGKVERLGELTDRIPADLRNRHLALGTQSLFDKDVPAARAHFESLRTTALEPAQLASVHFGLALAEWLDPSPDAPQRIEQLLTESARLLDPGGELSADWPATVATSAAENLATLTGERDVVLRNIHFLRGMAAVRAGDLTAAVGRFARARAHDPEFSDVHLVVGLIKYRLGDVEEGVTLLLHAQKLGVREPELRRIIASHQQPVARYLDVLDSYANDSAVLTEVRTALTGLARFRKPRDWDTRPDLPATHTAPTIADLGDRSAVLRERVTELLAAGADLGAARDLADDLGRDTAALVASARALQRKEAELLTLLGAALLPENGGLPR
ncbi:tetratricopeptide repeat protein [Lentzea aerocolonigenes]|uniref:tetratricopeptide repeat protein n=1 Tax=Lentzea aerocolonigenes TaxID=68170 RepID=UPI0004C394F6|nr:tetratricopeptide repeat protein [Lentzea aerocolonigenes]MCP2241622.1 Tetratricopeptide repeat [Lentzea aerocolonigenes]